MPASANQSNAALDPGFAEWGLTPRRVRSRTERAEAEVDRLRKVVHWFESQHGIDDDRVLEFYALLGGRPA